MPRSTVPLSVRPGRGHVPLLHPVSPVYSPVSSFYDPATFTKSYSNHTKQHAASTVFKTNGFAALDSRHNEPTSELEYAWFKSPHFQEIENLFITVLVSGVTRPTSTSKTGYIYLVPASGVDGSGRAYDYDAAALTWTNMPALTGLRRFDVTVTSDIAPVTAPDTVNVQGTITLRLRFNSTVGALCFVPPTADAGQAANLGWAGAFMVGV